MTTERPDPTWPKWVVRQTNACVFVQAPTPDAAVETAARKVGHMGGWRVGPEVKQEVFPRSEYREHAKPGTTPGASSSRRRSSPQDAHKANESGTTIRGEFECSPSFPFFSLIPGHEDRDPMGEVQVSQVHSRLLGYG